MSDEEDQVEVSEEEEEDEAEETPAKSAPSDHEEEEEEEEEDEETKSAASEEEEEEEEEPSGPSEAELAAKKRQTAEHYKALNEEAQELLSNNAVEREKLGSEIEEMRKRSERRKKEREAEEKRAAAKRTEEEAERKAAEEERRRKKEADELERKAKKLEKMAELERLKNPSKPNFVITKKDGPKIATEESTTASAPKKSKEQLEAEKQAILKQRIPALDIDGADGAKFKAKANELHALIVRLESEKYDLEKRFKSQQVDMMELAEKARNIHKTTGSEAIRRVALGQDEVDKVQERFAGCPSKVIMYSEFERQKDKRTYDDKRVNFTGPVFADPVAKIAPKRIVKWDESTGLPIYQTMDGAPVEEGHAAAQEEE